MREQAPLARRDGRGLRRSAAARGSLGYSGLCESPPRFRPKWMIAELSNYLSNNHPAQRHIYRDVHGRQTCCELRKCAGQQPAQVASGRRGRRFKSCHPDHQKPWSGARSERMARAFVVSSGWIRSIPGASPHTGARRDARHHPDLRRRGDKLRRRGGIGVCAHLSLEPANESTGNYFIVSGKNGRFRQAIHRPPARTTNFRGNLDAGEQWIRAARPSRS